MTRYLTYPCSEWFVEACGSNEIAAWFTAAQALDPVHAPVLAVQIPSRRDASADARDWLEALARETALYAGRLARGRALGEMHWALGSDPMPNAWLGALFDILASGFYFGSRPRLSASVAASVPDDVLPGLIAKGFARIDIGCAAEDDDAAAMAWPAAAVWQQRVLQQARALADAPSISLGLGVRYGVPGQSLTELAEQLDQVLACRPARIKSLPGTASNRDEVGRRNSLPMLQWLTARLAEAGYCRIASDTYALRGDLLEAAQRHGHLMMRPYGPSAAAGTTTIALGPAGVGAVGPAHYQNQRRGADYVAALAQGRLPVMRGISLSADDLVRRAVIHSLQCNLFVDIDALKLAYGIDFEQHFSVEMPLLAQLEQAAWISRRAGTIEIVGDGLLLVDNICAVFDAYLRRHRSSQPYTTLL